MYDSSAARRHFLYVTIDSGVCGAQQERSSTRRGRLKNSAAGGTREKALNSSVAGPTAFCSRVDGATV